MGSSRSKRHAALQEFRYGLLGVVLSIVASLAAEIFVVRVPLHLNVESGITILAVLSSLSSLLVAIFTHLLRREPSKVLQLRQRLVSAYVDRLAESIRGSGVAGQA